MSEGKEEKPVSGGGTPSQELPKTAAFQDEFTRGYMASPKEVEPGYYLFKSKTGGYTMLFPKDSEMSSDFGFEQHGNNYESFAFMEKFKNSNLETRITFEDRAVTKDIETNLSLLSTKVKYEGEFSKLKENDKMIYYAKVENTADDSYQYFSYIKSNKDLKAVSFYTSFLCNDSKTTCETSKSEYENHTLHLIKSVHFNN